MNKKLATLVLALSQSVATAQTMNLMLTGVEDTEEPFIFHIKNKNPELHLKLDCQSFIHYLHGRSLTDEALNFDLMVQPDECEAIKIETDTIATPETPLCMDIDTETGDFFLNRKCGIVGKKN